MFSRPQRNALGIWLVLWENHPLRGWRQGSTHPCVTMIILSASFQADVFWLPDEFLFLLTPNMHTYLNNSTKWEGYLHVYGKITLFISPEEGDFLTTRVNYISNCSLHCKAYIQHRLQVLPGYHPRSKGDNALGWVCPSVCPFVCALTIEPFDQWPSSFAWRSTFTLARLAMSVKVVGQRSRSNAKNHGCTLNYLALRSRSRSKVGSRSWV